jgi:hypothetical protein
LILLGIDATGHHELMKRGIWPEPHPEVVAAHEALAVRVEVLGPDSPKDSAEDPGSGVDRPAGTDDDEGPADGSGGCPQDSASRPGEEEV